MTQIAIVFFLIFLGAIALWPARSRHKRNLRRENWWTIFYIGLGMASMIRWKDEHNHIQTSEIIYAAIGLAVYAIFVYVWNLFEPKDSGYDPAPKAQ